MRSTPHILLLNEFYHPDICASAIVATDHMEHLAALRPEWNLTVLAGNRAWDDPNRVYPAMEVRGGVRILRVERPSIRRESLLSRGLGFAAFQRSVLRAARALDRIDLVIGTTAPPQGGLIAAKIAKTRSCPWIYHVLDLYPDLVVTLGRIRDNSFVHRRWAKIDRAAMQKAAAVVTISTPITDRIAATRGIDPQRLHTIHDGYDPARLAFTGPNTFAARTNPDGRFVVQYAGNMGLSHPLDTILQTARRMEADSSVLFQFIGDGPQRAIIERSLPANAQLHGYLPADQLGQVLAAAGVCLISQHDQMADKALPFKIYAILAKGKPFIFLGNPESEIACWAAESKAGLVVRHGDSAGLEGAIRKCMSSEASDMSKAARTFFEDRFDTSRVAKAWETMIRAVLPDRPGN